MLYRKPATFIAGRGTVMKTILLIEDDNDIRDTIGRLLRMTGYDVRSAANGQEGLERLREAPRPDLVLLDLMMPVKNGYEYAHEHRLDPNAFLVPIVVLSADRDLDSKKGQIAADAFLKKPVDLSTLLSTVSSFLDP